MQTYKSGALLWANSLLKFFFHCFIAACLNMISGCCGTIRCFRERVMCALCSHDDDDDDDVSDNFCYESF